MSAEDVIGYTYDADLWCAECAERLMAELDDFTPAPAPIFGNAESDVPEHCLECGALIPLTLTPDGREYAAGKIAYHRATGYGVASVLEDWRVTFGITEDEIRGAA